MSLRPENNVLVARLEGVMSKPVLFAHATPFSSCDDCNGDDCSGDDCSGDVCRLGAAMKLRTLRAALL